MKTSTIHFFHLKEETVTYLKDCLKKRLMKRRDTIFIIVDDINIVNSLKESKFYLDDDIYIIHNFSIHELYKVALQSSLRISYLGTFDANGTLKIENQSKWKRRNDLEVTIFLFDQF